MLLISGYCNASNGQAYLNGEPCLDSPVKNLESLIEALIQKYKVTHPRFGKMDRLSQLGFTIADMILQNTHLADTHDPFKLGMVLSNSSSSLDTDIKYWESTSGIPSPALFVYTLPNIVLAEISIKNKFKGENYFFISEKPDFNLLHTYITEMFISKRLEACLGGWVEVLENNFDAFLFLVEEKQHANMLEFTEENITTIYKKHNNGTVND